MYAQNKWQMVQYYDVTAASGSRAVPSRGQMPETQNLKQKQKQKKTVT